MPVSTQACRKPLIRLSKGGGAFRVLAFAALLPAAGCTSSGAALTDAGVDSVQTGDVARTGQPAPEQLSDQATIRNAVTSADISGLGGQPVAWANSDTGSRGAITALAEERQNGQVCRTFKTSRESFDGVALFQGEACMASAGVWKLMDFKPL